VSPIEFTDELPADKVAEIFLAAKEAERHDEEMYIAPTTIIRLCTLLGNLVKEQEQLWREAHDKMCNPVCGGLAYRCPLPKPERIRTPEDHRQLVWNSPWYTFDRTYTVPPVAPLSDEELQRYGGRKPL
jgi:hypothetical protein